MDLPSIFSTAGCSISLCELDFPRDLIDNLFIIFQASLWVAGREASAVFQKG